MTPPPPSIFKNRDFMLVWLGQAVSVIGDRVHNLVVAWWVLDRTGDPAKMGEVLLAGTLPLVLLAPLGGTFADRWDRRAILFASDLLRGLVVLALAWLDHTQSLTLPALIAATALIQSLSALFMPTLLAVTPSLVAEDQVMQASSLQDAVAGGAGVIGPALGGVLVAAVGPAWAFTINGTSYLVAAASSLLARITSPALSSEQPGVGAQLREGIAYLRQERLILGMIVVFGLLNFFAAPLQMFLPAYAKLVYARGPEALGSMEAALSIGLVVAGILLGAKAGQRSKSGPILGSILAVGALLIAFGFALPFPAALAALGAMGFAIGVANIFILVLFQERVPGDRLGRVMGLITTVTTAAQPVSFAVYGAASAHAGVPVLAMVSGAGVILGGLYLLALPGYRQI